jgi:hypothetical protein
MKPVQIKTTYFQQFKVAHLWSAHDLSPLFVLGRNLADSVNFNFRMQSCDESQHSKLPV